MTKSLTRRKALIAPIALPMAAGTARSAVAVDWPAQPLKIVVGGGAGSVPDTFARLAAEALARHLHQPVIVDNKPGAGGIVAIQGLKGNPPDGYTIALATLSQVVFNRYLYANLPYDPPQDLLPVSLLLATSSVLAAHPGVAATTLPELVALSQSNMGKLFIGVPAFGSPPHIAALLLLQKTGLRAEFVPFRTGPDALRAAIAGDVQLFIDAPLLVTPHVVNGGLKAIVVTGRERQKLLPTTPTIADAGFPAAEFESWMGLVAPKGTPPDVVERLSRETQAVGEEPDYRKSLEALGAQPRTATPEAFSALIRKEDERWSGLLRTAGIRLD